jgi:hypothetical protein
MALNRALDPFLPVLFRLAARGHWFQEKRPVRVPREGQPQSWAIELSNPRGYQLTASLTGEGELFLSLFMSDRGSVTRSTRQRNPQKPRGSLKVLDIIWKSHLSSGGASPGGD